jgi:integrase
MGQKLKLTDKAIRGIRAPACLPADLYWDTDLKGFGLRVTPNGACSWIVQYRNRLTRKQGRRTIGSVQVFSALKAREEARKILESARTGRDDLIDGGTKGTGTLRAYVEPYLAHAAQQGTLKPSSLAEARRHLNVSWQPLLDRPLSAMQPVEIVSVLDRISSNPSERATTGGRASANKARSTLSALFAWQIECGRLSVNPVIGTRKNKLPPRMRLLAESEVAEIWNACRDDDYGKLIKLLILTGARRSVVGDMAWSELNREQGLWTIPGSRKGMKTRHPHGRTREQIEGEKLALPLPELAWRIIDSVQPKRGRDFLFGTYGKVAGMTEFRRSKGALDRRILEARQEAAEKSDAVEPIRPWTVHDLRHFFSTRMRETVGIKPHIVEALMTHRGKEKQGASGLYNHAEYLEEKATALTLWADYIDGLIAGKSPKLVRLAERRRIAG